MPDDTRPRVIGGLILARSRVEAIAIRDLRRVFTGSAGGSTWGVFAETTAGRIVPVDLRSTEEDAQLALEALLHAIDADRKGAVR